MAITAETRTDIVELVVGMVGAAPGATILSELADVVDAGLSLEDLAIALADNPAFKALYPSFLTAEEFSTNFLTSLMGGNPGVVSQENFDLAVDALVSLLNAGEHRGAVMYQAITAISAVAEDDENFGPAAAQLNNQTEVAVYYSVTTQQSSESLDDLKAVIADVDNTDASVDAAKAVVDGTTNEGGSFVLTVDQDTLTGTTANDTFTAGAAQDGNGNLIDTLQDVDAVDGGAGTDTLNITALGGATITPALTDVENVNVRFTTLAGSDIDLSSSTGFTTAGISKSTKTGTISSVGSANLSVSNQAVVATFEGSTASTINLTATDYKVTGGHLVVVVDSATADAADALNLTVKNSDLDLDSTNNDAYTSVTVNATGTNVVTLTDVAAVATSVTTTGSGSVDLTNAALTAVKTVTGGDGVLKLDATGNGASSLKVTTGAGDDELTVTGANLTSVSSGGGDDEITVTTALKATSVVDAGAGDDEVIFGAAPTALATISGGDGTDIIGFTKADYATVSGYAAAALAKITGFEVLAITDILTAAGGPYDASTISGVTSFVAAGGVTNAETSSVTELGANATVRLDGAATATGVLAVALETDTADDSITITTNLDYVDNNDTTADDVASLTSAFDTSLIETVNLVSDSNVSLGGAPVAGYVADRVGNVVTLTNNDLVTLNISGDTAVSITTAAGMTDLETIDASALTGNGPTAFGFAEAVINASAAVGTSPDLTIIGSATGGNVLTGGAGDDTITGGANVDQIDGGAGADTINFNSSVTALNILVLSNVDDSTLIDLDVVTGFTPNTQGQGTNGAVTSAGAAAAITDRDGAVIDLNAVAGGATDLEVTIQANSSDAQTALQNLGSDGNAGWVNVALDTSTSRLFIDVDDDGTVDSVIQLNGVTTIDEAAFVL